MKNHNLQAHNVVRIFTPSNKANKYHPPRASNWMADLKSGQIQNKGPLCGHICCCVLQIQVRMHSVSVNTKENLTFELTPPSLISLWLSTVWQRKKNETKFQRWAGSCKAMTAVAALTSLWPYLRRHNTTRIASRGGNGFINLFPFTRPPPSHLYFYSVLIIPLQVIWSDK